MLKRGSCWWTTAQCGVRSALYSPFIPISRYAGEAQHGLDAIEQTPTLLPDLIILDLSMPVMNGLEAAPLLVKMLPTVWLILFTLYDEPEVHRKQCRNSRGCSQEQCLSPNPSGRSAGKECRRLAP
jgi:CheY-like chemotaxis protein